VRGLVTASVRGDEH